MALTNASGTVQERIKYDAFGSVTWMDAAFATKSSSGYAWNRTFTGQVRDSELGLMLYRNRYYSTGLGRFINRDPIGYLAGDTNLYRYCFNMPNGWLDPMGFGILDWFSPTAWSNWWNSGGNSDTISAASTIGGIAAPKPLAPLTAGVDALNAGAAVGGLVRPRMNQISQWQDLMNNGIGLPPNQKCN